jgi:hypothetical protein
MRSCWPSLSLQRLKHLECLRGVSTTLAWMLPVNPCGCGCGCMKELVEPIQPAKCTAALFYPSFAGIFFAWKALHLGYKGHPVLPLKFCCQTSRFKQSWQLLLYDCVRSRLLLYCCDTG